MSLDIGLYQGEQEVLSMNWLRNPYGLCNWAEDNFEMAKGKRGDLYDVCNQWAYGKSKKVDRKLFKRVVMRYSKFVKSLDEGYFLFDLACYRQFVQPNYELFLKDPSLGFSDLLRIYGEKYFDPKQGDTRLAIPMEQFNQGAFNLSHRAGQTMIEKYQEWFDELVEFAHELQDENLEFYCSN